MKRSATANWKGGLKDGSGTVTAPSGIFSNAPYNFSKRFEDAPGTNPEELIAAAHASCYAMALSGELGKMGMTADAIDARATVSFEKRDAGFTITSSHLDVTVKVANGDQAKFQQAAAAAKAGCPISRLLNAEITLEAKLVAG
jgi:osmotically inducible protein OsmC